MSGISVILCTHNPRPSLLRETIVHLQAQTLPRPDWELLLVDNASEPALSAAEWTGWHPAGRVIAEPDLGLTNARLAGISAARGDLIVFVDDDNWLDADYLATAARLFGENPQLGAASGRCIGVFEKEPLEWQKSYLWLIVVRTGGERRCTRDLSAREALPAGAGMVLRRSVTAHYAAFCKNNPAARLLDRRGTRVLLQGGDTHIVQCAIELGFEVGFIPGLRLRHYIPASRLELGYLSRLYAGIVTSGYIFGYLLHGRADWPRRGAGWWWRQIRGRLRNFHHQGAFLRAEIEGEREARRLVSELTASRSR